MKRSMKLKFDVIVYGQIGLVVSVCSYLCRYVHVFVCVRVRACVRAGGRAGVSA